jgi:hypothetical protein
MIDAVLISEVAYKKVLTEQQGQILRHLIDYSFRPIQCGELVQTIYGNDPEGGPLFASEQMKVQICNIRKKLKPYYYIKARWGFGYQLMQASVEDAMPRAQYVITNENGTNRGSVRIEEPKDKTKVVSWAKNFFDAIDGDYDRWVLFNSRMNSQKVYLDLRQPRYEFKAEVIIVPHDTGVFYAEN